MIIHMNNTSSAAVGLRMEELRDTVGSVALGRVLTLVIIANDSAGIRDGMQAAAGASRAHPCRIVAIHAVDADEPQLDAEIRVGAEAGLSEIAILRCSGGAGSDLETVLSPSSCPIHQSSRGGFRTSRREPPPPQLVPSPSAASPPPDSSGTRSSTSALCAILILREILTSLGPGMTLWRNHLAAMLDEPPEEPVLSVTVEGASEHPSTYLLAGWLALHLQVPVTIDRHQGAVMTEVSLHRESGDLRLVRPLGSEIADMIRPGRQTQRVNLPVRTMETMLIEELRSMTADVAYGEVLQNGLPLLDIPEFQR